MCSSDLRRGCSRFGELGELLGVVFAGKRVEQFVEIAVHDGVDLAQGEVDAVVGDAPLGEVVGADAFAAVAGADLELAVGVAGGAAYLSPGSLKALLRPQWMLAGDPALRARLGAAARAKVQARYSAGAMTRAVESEYRRHLEPGFR